MRRNLKALIALMLFIMLVTFFPGCGDGGYETASRLEISQIICNTACNAGCESTSVVQSDVVEDTDESGLDGVPGTNDDGEGDNRPQPKEEVTNPLAEDFIRVTFTNTLREGSDTGVDIEVYKYVITYYDEYGYTPYYAPQSINDMQLIVPSGSTVDFEMVIVDFNMKIGWLENSKPILGLRDLYLYDQNNFKSKLFAQIDFYGRDPLNNEPAFTSGSVRIDFTNYIPN